MNFESCHEPTMLFWLILAVWSKGVELAPVYKFYLATVPRTGNHFFRRSFELSTGIATHAMYKEPNHRCDNSAYDFCVADTGAYVNAEIGEPMIVKTHFPFISHNKLEHGCGDAVITILREPLHNYASWRRYTAEQGWELDSFSSFAQKSERFFDFWESCAEQVPKLTILYDTLVKRPRFAMRQVARFAQQVTGQKISLRDIDMASLLHHRPFDRQVNCNRETVQLDGVSISFQEIRDALSLPRYAAHLRNFGELMSLAEVFDCARETSQIMAGRINSLPNSQVAILAFFNAQYADVTREWLLRLDRLGLVSHVVLGFLSRNGHADACNVFKEQFPGLFCVLVSVGDALSLEHTDFWRSRLRLINNILSYAKNPFIHSDVDAFWQADVGNALRRWAQLHHTDMMFSIGTFPRSFYDTHGFANCVGLWYISPTSRSRFFMADLLAERAPGAQNYPLSADDQEAVNQLLVEWNVRYRKRGHFRLGECVLGDEVRLRVAAIPLEIVARSCPTTAPIAHCLTDKTSTAKLGALGQLSAVRTEADFERLDKDLWPFLARYNNSTDNKAGQEGGAWTYCTHLLIYGTNLDIGLANFLATKLRPLSAFELGPGLGLYLDFLRRFSMPTPRTLVGAEPESMVSAGVLKTAESAHGPYQLAVDICSQAFPLEKLGEFELVFTIEVLEHVDASLHSCFIDALVSLTGKWLVFSAARPGQGGHGHVAERSAEEWVAEFTYRGMLHVSAHSEALRDLCSARNVNHKRNMLFFRKHGTEVAPGMFDPSAEYREENLRRVYGTDSDIWPDLQRQAQLCRSVE